LTLLYDTGGRVQELVDLCVGDVTFSTHSTVDLHGKGNKSRSRVPILPETAKIIKGYLNEYTHRVEPLFYSTGSQQHCSISNGQGVQLRRHIQKI